MAEERRGGARTEEVHFVISVPTVKVCFLICIRSNGTFINCRQYPFTLVFFPCRMYPVRAGPYGPRRDFPPFLPAPDTPFRLFRWDGLLPARRRFPHDPLRARRCHRTRKCQRSARQKWQTLKSRSPSENVRKAYVIRGRFRWTRKWPSSDQKTRLSFCEG